MSLIDLEGKTCLDFPKRVYTEEEVSKARELVEKGYKHSLKAEGSPTFKQKVKQALELVKAAGYYDFLRTYIRTIKEIDGLTQLRQADATIWANMYAVENPVDAASLFVQKASHMKEYVEGKLYYGGASERRSDEKRIEFLKVLEAKSQEKQVREECARILELWREGYWVY
jgi:hypothetical protein